MKAPVVFETAGAFFVAVGDAQGDVINYCNTSTSKLSVFILGCAKFKQ
jgi:hypothetical protein